MTHEAVLYCTRVVGLLQKFENEHDMSCCCEVDLLQNFEVGCVTHKTKMKMNVKICGLCHHPQNL